MKSNSPKSENFAWTQGAVWFCTKCFKETTVAEDMKSDLKNHLREMGRAKDLRVMTSSCLGICPEKAQAMVILPVQGKPEACSFDPEKDREQVFQKVLSHLKP
ncbi:MAG: hypothetical protein ACK5Y2_08160 [Bdellovibrionales bacterium]